MVALLHVVEVLLVNVTAVSVSCREIKDYGYGFANVVISEESDMLWCTCLPLLFLVLFSRRESGFLCCLFNLFLSFCREVKQISNGLLLSVL